MLLFEAWYIQANHPQGIREVPALGEHPFSIQAVIEKIPLLPGRMRIIPGLKKSVIIDDSYNASPVANEELLMVLQKIEGKKN